MTWKHLFVFGSTYALLVVNDSIYITICWFHAEEWVSAVVQANGIGQYLRLTPKKHGPINFSIKKKRSNSLRKGFLKKQVQISIACHVNISIIPATRITEHLFTVMFFVVLLPIKFI